MILGVALPIIILLYYELKLNFRPQVNTQYELYKSNMSRVYQKSDSEQQDDVKANLRGSRILGLGIFATGLLMLVLGIISSSGKGMLFVIAALVTILGGMIASRGIINWKRTK